MTEHSNIKQLKALIKEQQAELSRLSEVERRLNSILDVIAGIHWSKDKNSIYRSCNNAMVEALGLKAKEDIIGKSDYELPWSEQADHLVHNDREVMLTGQVQEGKEELVKTNDGLLRTFMVTKAPLYNEQSEIVGTVGCSVDITHIKELEQELRASKEAAEAGNAAKTEFLANMRHDIRTPLSGIVGFAELLKSESPDPRIQEYAENLVASSHALLDLMDEVLEAVRVSSGEIPILKKKFALQESFEKIIALYLAKSHQKGIQLQLEMDNRLPRYVIGDKIRLHRIILELVGNALNFTDKGHVILGVHSAKSDEKTIVLKITVSDTGIGIPKEKQHEIFIQFKRLTPSYQGIYKGIGLGLYVVKQFINELGGEMYVESEPKQGTCFTCLIPLQLPLLDDASGIDHEQEDRLERPYMQPLAARQTNTNESNDKSIDKARILVVEDNVIAQSAARSILSAMHCQVDIASNGNEALKLFAANTYHLIFMDIGLGEGIDGYEVTHRLRNNQTTPHTPIVALTSHGGDENKQRCIEAGMDGVLTKPLTQTHAADMIKAFISEVKSVDPTRPARRDLPDTDDELFHLNQFTLLDAALGLTTCGSEVMFIELLTLAVTEVFNELEQMKKAFASGDFSLVEKIAHKMKGGAVYVGLVRMKYACQYLERYCKTGETTLFEALYYQAVQVINETLIHAKEWLKKKK